MLGPRSIFSRRAVSTLFVLLLSCSALMFGEETGGRKVKNRTTVPYPEIAKKLSLSGVVKLEVLVAQNGDVRDVKVLGGNPLLAEAAVSAVKQWKYESGEEGKQLVDVKFNPAQ